jgi:ATP-dependent Zn protease
MQNQLIDLLVSWAPFLILIGITFFFINRRTTGNVSTVTALQERQIAESQRMNTLLERIAVSLEKREAD